MAATTGVENDAISRKSEKNQKILAEERNSMSNTIENQQYITIADAKRRYSISATTLYRLFNEGKITGFKVGRSTRIKATEIEAYFANLPRLETRGKYDREAKGMKKPADALTSAG